MNRIILFLGSVIAAVFLAFVFQPDAPISGRKFPLGQGGYDVEELVIPGATGKMLEVLSYVMTKSRVAPFIRRVMLNQNKIVNLRELASQISLPPMYFPMRRLTPKEREQHPSETDIAQYVLNGVSDQADENWHLRSIKEYSQFYLQGHKPSEVLKKTMKTIKDWEYQDFRVFSYVDEEAVLRQARESDQRYAEGKPLSVFDGVPFAFKDQMDVKGHRIYEGTTPVESKKVLWIESSRDDLMIERLRELGAIVLGVTVMVEGGVSPLGYNSHFQGPTNAHSLHRYSGGSSSGSAAAVASGLVPVAIGFDGGGSIRVPCESSLLL